MICDKCGKVLPDGAKFCGRCGASLSPRAVPKPEPVPKQVFEPVPAPVTEPKPEKVSSPKTKKLILFGAIGAAVVAAALVVLFVVILPAVNGGKSGDSKDSKSAVVSGTGEQSADASDGIKLDILSYVKEHDLITQTGSSDWNLDVAVKAFEAEINGCKIRKPDDEPLTEVSVRDPNGNKILTTDDAKTASAEGFTQNLWPGLIDLHLTNTDSWLLDEESTTEERIVVYYNKILPAGEDLSKTPLCDTLTIDRRVADKATQTVTDDGKTIVTKYDYDGWQFCLEAEVDAVQTHNAEDAIRSAWGRDVNISDDGTLTLVK